MFLFSDPWNPFLGFRFNKIDPKPIPVLVIPSDIMLKLSVFLFPFVYLIVCLNLTSLQQLRSYRDGPQLKLSSDRLVKQEIKHTTPDLQVE